MMLDQFQISYEPCYWYLIYVSVIHCNGTSYAVFLILMFNYIMNISKLFNCIETRARVKVIIFKFTLLLYNETFLEKWCWLSHPSVLPNVKPSALKVEIWLLKHPYLNEALKSFIHISWIIIFNLFISLSISS